MLVVVPNDEHLTSSPELARPRSASVEGESRNGRPDHRHLKQQQERSHPPAIFKGLVPAQGLVDAEERHLVPQVPQEKIEQIRKARLWRSEERRVGKEG